MSKVLYHYVHCPYCVRVRMGLGYLQIPYISRVLPYDDEKTPVSLTGTKMLPIMDIEGKVMNESLDILQALDHSNRLKVIEYKTLPLDQKLDSLLTSWGETVHSLAMPYWIFTPEFSDSSRRYFQAKKEMKRGPFRDLVGRKEAFIEEMDKKLRPLAEILGRFYQSEEFRLQDILIAAQLWGLYVVPEFQFPDVIHAYLMRVKAETRFNYHQDFWRNSESSS